MPGQTASPYGTIRGAGPNDLTSGPVAPTATYVVNDLLTLDSSGRLQQTVTGTTVTSLATGAIYAGIAQQNATGYSPGGTDVWPSNQYLIAKPGYQFILPIYTSSASSLAKYNASMQGNQYLIEYLGAAGAYGVNIDATNASGQVIMRDPVAFANENNIWPQAGGAQGVAQAFVYVEWAAAACRLTGI